MEKVFGTWRISVERTPLTDTELARMYDLAAPSWHSSISLLGYLQAYADLFARLRTEGLLGRLQNAAPVLDCGIGTAALSLALTRTIPARLQIHGVDIAPQMLREARHNLATAHVNAQLQCQDVRDLPFDDHSFELVMSAHMLEHLPDPFAGLREMSRVLRPGAPLLLIVTRPGILGSLIHMRWRNTCIDPAVLEDWMTKIGLSTVQLHEFAAGPRWCRWISIACVGLKT